MPRRALLWTLLFAVALGVNGGALRSAVAPAGIVTFEFAARPDAAAAIVASWRARGALDDAWLSMLLDMPFLALYGYTIAVMCDVGPPKAPAWALRVGWWLARAAVLAAALDLLENLMLVAWLAWAGPAWGPAVAAVAAGVKFALVLPAALFAVGAWAWWR